MHRPIRLTLVFTVLISTSGCGGADSAPSETVITDAAARPSVIMVIPVGTSNEAAREHFLLGQRDLDLGRTTSARTHFAAAAAADDAMALAHLRAAQTASSFDEYRTQLDLAVTLADEAREVESLLIEIERLGYEGDRQGQLATAEALVEAVPSSPRAWILLGSIQAGFNEVETARASIARAIELAPDYAGGHLALANSLVLRSPLDPGAAAEHARRAIELEPGEALPHDLLGDAHRAAGDLERARTEYERAAELDPSGSAYQQLGHVNTFLGNYDEARADYDRAIALAEGNAPANFGTWRAFVHLHEGDPQAAIDELNELVDAIDALGIPEPVGVKIGVLGQIGTIAIHNGLLAQAENAHSRRAVLLREQIAEVGTDTYRRGAEADMLYRDGIVAAATGDVDAANLAAAEIMTLLEPDSDPRKDEMAHDLLGRAAFYAGEWDVAVGHLEQGNVNNVYNQYLRARAYQATDDTAHALELYQGIADNRFNNVYTAMLRTEALEAVGTAQEGGL